MPMKTRALIRLLEKHGFKVVSQNGSHAKFKNATTIIIVPIHRREVPKGILQSILKTAGIKPTNRGGF